MTEKKRRLTTGEVRAIIEHCKQYGNSALQIGDCYYNLDDVYQQFLLLHDAIAAILVEHLLLGRELR